MLLQYWHGVILSIFHVSVHKSRCEYIGSQVLSCLLFVMSLYPSSIHRKYFSWLYRISSEFLEHCPKLILSLVISIYIIKWCIYESCIRFCIRYCIRLCIRLCIRVLYDFIYEYLIHTHSTVFNLLLSHWSAGRSVTFPIDKHVVILSKLYNQLT